METGSTRGSAARLAVSFFYKRPDVKQTRKGYVPTVQLNASIVAPLTNYVKLPRSCSATSEPTRIARFIYRPRPFVSSLRSLRIDFCTRNFSTRVSNLRTRLVTNERMNDDHKFVSIEEIFFFFFFFLMENRSKIVLINGDVCLGFSLSLSFCSTCQRNLKPSFRKMELSKRAVN